MGIDAAELVVASNGSVSVAPAGTALPTTPSASLNAAFVDLGYVTEDGVTLTVEPSVEEFMAWQSRQAVRRELTGQAISVGFELEQWSADSVTLAFGGGQITSASGVYKYEWPSDSDSLEEVSCVIDWQDGDRSWRACFGRATITDSVETTFQRSSLATLPITLSVLDAADGGAPGYIVTDDPAFNPGS